jgi:hypothetical protein
MKAFGGKFLFRILDCLILVGLFISCDFSKPIEINEMKNYLIDTECGTISFRGTRFTNAVLVNYRFNGLFIVQPDSLIVEFYPNNIKMIDVKYKKSYDSETISDKIIVMENNTLLLYYNLYSDIPYNFDTAIMYILPCNYILCKEAPLITDTIRISLK